MPLILRSNFYKLPLVEFIQHEKDINKVINMYEWWLCVLIFINIVFNSVMHTQTIIKSILCVKSFLDQLKYFSQDKACLGSSHFSAAAYQWKWWRIPNKLLLGKITMKLSSRKQLVGFARIILPETNFRLRLCLALKYMRWLLRK